MPTNTQLTLNKLFEEAYANAFSEYSPLTSNPYYMLADGLGHETHVLTQYTTMTSDIFWCDHCKRRFVKNESHRGKKYKLIGV